MNATLRFKNNTIQLYISNKNTRSQVTKVFIKKKVKRKSNLTAENPGREGTLAVYCISPQSFITMFSYSLAEHHWLILLDLDLLVHKN